MASKPMLVVAIDFGTTYSGCAYSFRTEYEENPFSVSSPNFVCNTQTAKVSSSVLFNPEEKLDCFGQEAEDKYALLSVEDPEEARNWYYFERFKMTLHKNMTLTRDTILPDQTKKKGMPALDVFSATIKFIRDHLMNTLKEREIPFKELEIKWILTIPAIWDDNAKNFMREAAVKAGIPTDRLELVLEPEAASVYCLEYNKANNTLVKDLSLLQPGTRFMMVDCGGGTIDISVFEVRDGNVLRHLHRPEGSPDGGIIVDETFKHYIFEVVGMEGAAKIDRMEMLLLRRQFERTKRMNPKSKKVAVEVPATVQTALNDALSESEMYAERVSMLRNKLLIDLDIYKSFFNESVTSITKYIRTVLADKKVGHVDAILLAGGFSESDIIQKAVRDAFSHDRVLVVPSPSAAVLIGAVMLGHNPNTITTRVSAYTYGVDCTRAFLEGLHDPKKKITTDHGVHCSDLFSIFIKRDQEIEVNTLLPYQTYKAGYANQTKAIFSIYRSTKQSPMYVDEEGCEKIGSVTLPMPDTTGGKDREIKAAMMVGGTELKFVARDENTNTEVTVLCDFLSKTTVGTCENTPESSASPDEEHSLAAWRRPRPSMK